MADLWIENERFQIKGVPDRVKLNQLNNLLHDSLIATGHVERCAIVDKKETEVKANSPGFTLTKDQIHVTGSFQNFVAYTKGGSLF